MGKSSMIFSEGNSFSCSVLLPEGIQSGKTFTPSPAYAVQTTISQYKRKWLPQMN